MRKMIVALSFCVTTAVYASEEAGAKLKIFEDLGFSTNVTGSSSYKTQAAGYKAFGSSYSRTEVRSLQLMHVDSPTMRAGCGGIDIFAGGFSFIKGTEIVRFMKNILANGGGYAFNLALETELPEMAHAMQFVQTIATKINNLNISSCELSESLVQGLWSKRRQAHEKLCEDIGMNNSIFSDWAAARQGCSTGTAFEGTIETGKADARYKDKIFINKNVVWDSILANDFLKNNTSLAEVYLSISGTLVFNQNSSLSTYPSLATNRNFIKALLYGGKLPAYHCDEAVKCLNIALDEKTSYQEIQASEALVAQIEQLLDDIYKKITSDTALTDEEKGLIAMSSTEIFRLVASNAQQGVGVTGAHALAETLATEILSQFLSHSVGIIRHSLAGKELDESIQKKIFGSLSQVQIFVAEIEKNARAQFNQALQTNALINENVRIAMAQLSLKLEQ